MRNKIFRLAVVTIGMSAAVCGCRKTPESITSGDIRHAKGAVENEVAEIVEAAGTDSEMGSDLQEINCTIGTKENAITIQAQMPQIPVNVYCMALKENDALTKELLIEFLGSDSENISDLSEQAQKEKEQSEAENEQGEERLQYSVFGSAPVCQISDGQKTAAFNRGTSAYYVNDDLKKKCDAIYKSDETVCGEAELTENGDSLSFTVKEAEDMLLEQLSIIDVEEICEYDISMHQKEDFAFYEIEFTPSYEGMGIVHEFGSVGLGEISPRGNAWICEDGIAYLSLASCLGMVEQQEKCGTLLSWEQIEKIIEVNLNNHKINGSSEAVLTNAEFLYYPIFNEEKNELELIPVWQIYTPLSTWIENEELTEQFGMEGAAWNICINAISGEIVRVE